MERSSIEEADRPNHRFTADDVLWFLELADRANVACWLVGGWGVDALLEGQTRPHSDLDIVVQASEHEALRDGLEAQGVHVLLDEHHRPRNYVLVDAVNRRIDFHVIRFDEAGNGLYEPPFSCPAGSLEGRGFIAGTPVRCATPRFQVEDHLGYVPQKKDHHDVRALCHRYGMPLPDGFER